MTHKTHLAWLLAWLLAFLLLPLAALADDAGVLTEGELNLWLMNVLQRTQAEQPQNQPAQEDSITEDGYAFLYSFATLYYNKPVLDEKSVLNAFTITDESYPTLRGLRLGDSAQLLISTYGWQNPDLLGDGSFAALYLLNQLPQNAYWAWAQHDAGAVDMVQCAIHAEAGGGMYTDAGIRYQLHQGEISSIHVYGLNRRISQVEVESNLAAVAGVQAAANGEAPPPATQGDTLYSGAEAFAPHDLHFAGLAFEGLTQEAAQQALGAPLQEDWAQDDTGDWLYTAQWEGITLSYALDASRQNSRLETLSVIKPGLAGPRGIQVGDSLAAVQALFRSDGTGLVKDRQALLYGDGLLPPYGALEKRGESATLRYVAALTPTQEGSSSPVTLHLTFEKGILTEMMAYTW